MMTRFLRLFFIFSLVTLGVVSHRFSTLFASIDLSFQSGVPLTLEPDQTAFTQQFESHIKQLDQEPYDPNKYRNLQVGQRVFAPISHVRPTQNLYSFLFVLEKISLDAKKYTEIKEGNITALKEASGASLYPLEKAKPVIVTDSGLLLVDGHHSVFAAGYARSTLMPLEIKAIWTDLTEEQLWKKMDESGYAYLIDEKGNKKNPPLLFSEMVDEPYRYLASMVILEITSDGKIDVKQTVGTEYPVAVKVNVGVPFIEFHLANIFRKYGIQVSLDQMSAKKLNLEIIDDIRRALSLERLNGNSYLAGLDLVIERRKGNRILDDIMRFSHSNSLKGRENSLIELFPGINLKYIDFVSSNNCKLIVND